MSGAVGEGTLGVFVLLLGIVLVSVPLRGVASTYGYAEGFHDGCHSGREAAGSWSDGFAKDLNRFGVDRDYTRGWSDGFRQCETAQERDERSARQASEWQKLPAERREALHPATRAALGGGEDTR